MGKFYLINECGEIYNGEQGWSMKKKDGIFYIDEMSAIKEAENLIFNNKAEKISLKFVSPVIEKKNPVLRKFEN